MKLPVVSIVGKPNTGKSSLFNVLVGRGKAIVYDKAGTTIDINREIVDIDGVKFILQDTGGYMFEDTDAEVPKKLTSRIRELLIKAIEESLLVLFTVEYNNVSFLDYELADILRKYTNKVKLVVTKVDTIHQRILVVDEVYRLGFKSMFFVSSKTKYGFEELVDGIRMFLIEELGEQIVNNSYSESFKVAIVGRINVGKSTIMNALLGKDRVMVDDEPGTTRDSIDDFIESQDSIVRITDTAGFRRSLFKAGLIERFGIERTENAIKNSDVVVIVIDGKEGITKQDKKALGVVLGNYKPFVIAVNKWDLVVGIDKLRDEKEMEKYHSAFVDFLSRSFENIRYAPVVLVSAKEKYNLDKLMEEVSNVFQKSRKRISTGLLNRKIRDLVPHLFTGEVATKLRIYYITQIDVNPPTFVVFVNKEEFFKKNVENFIKKKITEIFDFGGVPVKILVKQKERRKK